MLEIKCGNVIVPYKPKDYRMSSILIIKVIHNSKDKYDCRFIGFGNGKLSEMYIVCNSWYVLC